MGANFAFIAADMARVSRSDSVDEVIVPCEVGSSLPAATLLRAAEVDLPSTPTGRRLQRKSSDKLIYIYWGETMPSISSNLF